MVIEERERDVKRLDGSVRSTSEVVMTVSIRRYPNHVLISIVLPLVLLVSLSWCVFWMDDESISSRVNISFVGILSVVAYYFVIMDSVPKISYVTLMDGFIITTFLILFASVVVNFAVDKLNRSGRREVGDRLDLTCRWAFPVGYLLTTCLLVLIFFSIY